MDYADAVLLLGTDPRSAQALDRALVDAEVEASFLHRRADHDLVWIAGSTQAPEEEIALGIFQRVLLSNRR